MERQNQPADGPQRHAPQPQLALRLGKIGPRNSTVSPSELRSSLSRRSLYRDFLWGKSSDFEQIEILSAYVCEVAVFVVLDLITPHDIDDL
jgi:hypothetical protein